MQQSNYDIKMELTYILVPSYLSTNNAEQTEHLDGTNLFELAAILFWYDFEKYVESEYGNKLLSE